MALGAGLGTWAKLSFRKGRIMDARDLDFHETDLGPLGKYFEVWDVEADDGYGELILEGCVHWNSPDSTSFEVAEAIIY